MYFELIILTKCVIPLVLLKRSTMSFSLVAKSAGIRNTNYRTKWYTIYVCTFVATIYTSLTFCVVGLHVTKIWICTWWKTLNTQAIEKVEWRRFNEHTFHVSHPLSFLPEEVVKLEIFHFHKSAAISVIKSWYIWSHVPHFQPVSTHTLIMNIFLKVNMPLDLITVLSLMINVCIVAYDIFSTAFLIN